MSVPALYEPIYKYIWIWSQVQQWWWQDTCHRGPMWSVDAPLLSQAAQITLAFVAGALSHIRRISGSMVRPRCMRAKVEHPPQKKVSDDWMGVLIHITAIDKADWKIYIYNMNCMELNAMRKHLWLLRSYSVKLNSLSCSRVLRYSMYKSISSSFWNAKFSSSISLKMGKDSHVQVSWRGK